MFLMLLFTTGLAIDFAVKEGERADLQNALDRCILASASLTQTGNTQQICEEYMAKRTFGYKSTNVAAARQITGVNTSTVDACAIMRSDTTFLALAGLPFIDMQVCGSATEGDNNVEISLVLDISGSMTREETLDRHGVSRKRLDVMKDAAKTFVTNTLTGPGSQNTSISLVPFSGQVNVGPFFDLMLNGTRDHGFSSCLDFNDSDFNNLSLPNGKRQQTPHFQHFFYERMRGQPNLPINPNGGNNTDWGWCPTDTQALVPFQDSIIALHDDIDAFVGHDGTGTQYGMKWGLALLDPSTQPMIANMAVDPNLDLPPRFGTRPGPYGPGGPQKFIVIMTDGRIRHQNRPKNSELNNNPEFFHFNENATFQCTAGGQASRCADNILISNRDRANLGSQSAENDDEDDRRQQFLDLCAAADLQGIRVFTIAFGFLPDDVDPLAASARAMLTNCANPEGGFFDAQNGTDLDLAFNAIVAEVQRLKLFR